MFDYKGASFSTYDVDQSNVLVEYENGYKQKVDCSQQNSGAWWYGKNSTSCRSNTNLNAFNYDNIMYFNKHANVSQITLYRSYGKHYTHRMLIKFLKQKSLKIYQQNFFSVLQLIYRKK